ncbi:MAG: hypothetical protein GTO17_02295 [Candidatus Aminicenantes bacterium]|nr:hypothetical protein [Candidatus Aminicenantes bacterium]
MKKFKILVLLALILIFAVHSFSFRSSATRANSEENTTIGLAKGKSVFTLNADQLGMMNAIMEREIALGNLNLVRTQTERDNDYLHQRYKQHYQNIPVWGAQLIRHFRAGKAYCINGRYYDDINIEVVPELEKESAVEIAKNDTADSGYRSLSEPELTIFPAESGYHLSYKVILRKRPSEMIYFVDARTGEIILKYENMKTTAEIGVGTGVHNDTKKMSADSTGATYQSRDRMRPAVIKTFDMEYDFWTWWWYSSTDSNLGEDNDNDWSDVNSDKAVVDGHCYTGWTYDYFYLVHGREGYDGSNLTMKVFVNFSTSATANAFYDGWDDSINFYDGDGVNTTYVAGALDVVAHEIAHGVTNYTSGLIYWFYSGALNEAFSDIMGACAEFFHQPEGTGHMQADWLVGEDIYIIYHSSNVFRRMDKPHLLSTWFSGPYPDHYSLRYTGSLDNKGVHVNSSIANHWFYLLSEGETNRTSGISVTGIGLSKAEKIAYRAWVHYLVPSSEFPDARSACVQAAADLYGAGSTEVSRVKRAWDAVGVF